MSRANCSPMRTGAIRFRASSASLKMRRRNRHHLFYGEPLRRPNTGGQTLAFISQRAPHKLRKCRFVYGYTKSNFLSKGNKLHMQLMSNGVADVETFKARARTKPPGRRKAL
jgi:hypothetical protein